MRRRYTSSQQDSITRALIICVVFYFYSLNLILIDFQVKFHTDTLNSTQAHHMNLQANKESLSESKLAILADKSSITGKIKAKTRQLNEIKRQKDSKYIK